ncbi:ATP-binding cassette domain-containing protein [Micromonospora arida]|uniref:ABC transporter domain-containing protein n=1 Tax=Micromonospora arida TaxID=2203715 RepID=A0A3N9XVJ3_9ACTN|nr:ABC transporter ATP-binding protein [Micromonospora arida]RQX10897.1 hypothetical protein DLJ58_10290 [Micromonospora arida]
MKEPLLALDAVTVGMKSRTILSEVSLRLTPGGWFGLVGPNGCGKTTLMRAALGLLRPLAGTVRLAGTPPPYPTRWASASFGPRLTHPRRRVRTELRLRVSAIGGDRSDLDRAWADTGLTDSRVCCGDLSLGQAQRLAVATALVGQPRLLVLDEPTVGLDAGAVHWLRNRLRRYAAAGGCVWVSSHDLHEVERSADEIAVLGQGRLAYAGPVAGFVGERAVAVHLRSSEPDLLRRVLAQSGARFSEEPDLGVTVHDGDAAQLGRLLAAHQVPLLSMAGPSSDGLRSALDDLVTVAGRPGAEKGRIQ